MGCRRDDVRSSFDLIMIVRIGLKIRDNRARNAISRIHLTESMLK
jgi:hypothetical protein